MRRLASIGLSTSATFLAVVAVLLNSPNLFYMGTALLCTIAACRLQAWLSVRSLRFERVAPESVSIGDIVTVEITVWSGQRVRRPLITIWDNLPPRLAYTGRSPSLPVAPAHDIGILTHYSFRPLKRGKFRWSGLTAVGTDALGLITMSHEYKTNVAELTVLPNPIPVSVDLPMASGWGISEAESGQSRGAGLEPRGIREYQFGDPLRHVHWRSSARAGQLLVKEFEAGSYASVAFLIQRTTGTDLGEGLETSLELMCGHVAYLAEKFVRSGARVLLPLIEVPESRGDRLTLIYEMLASIQADVTHGLGEDVHKAVSELVPGSTLFVLHAVADQTLPPAISAASGSGVRVVPLVYDAKEFVGDKPKTRVDSAADSGYLDQLRAAGTTPIMMPDYGSVSA